MATVKKAKPAARNADAAPKPKAPVAQVAGAGGSGATSGSAKSGKSGGKGGGGKSVDLSSGRGSRSAASADGTTRPEAPTTVHKSHSFRRQMTGVVTSDKMDKTVTVEVVRRSLDQVYKKYVRQRNRYKAHDELNQYRTGDRVEITEHAPISREKRWLVTRLVARRVEG